MRLDCELDNLDIAARKNFAKNELNRIDRTYNSHHRTWFGGEATFYTNGRVECHNLVYLSEDSSNPESDFPPPRTDSSVTVLAALNSENLLGPYIFADKTDLSIYQIFLRKFVFELHELQQVHTKLSHAIFMHDDSPVHEDAKEFLDEEFPEYWVGPGSKHAEWPRLSPDLQPLCFFLWGHIKHKVYETPIEDEDVNELVLRIHHAFAEIMPEMLASAVKAYKERLKMVIEEDGDLVDVHEDDEYEPAPIYSKALRMTT
uniref:Tc1-like transposase DDE domain-containing protein n=1 Tax=Acrobeloides nanus TaxID=290746 RepID=A0A914CYQ7_9BILA